VEIAQHSPQSPDVAVACCVAEWRVDDGLRCFRDVVERELFGWLAARAGDERLCPGVDVLIVRPPDFERRAECGRDWASARALFG